jgi:hypothetical protein
MTTPLTPDSPAVQDFLAAWHENERPGFERDHDRLHFDTYAPKVAKARTKYLALNRDTSGMFLADRVTGLVWSIKGYGVPNRPLGSLAALTRAYQAATLAGRTFSNPGYVATDAALAKAAGVQDLRAYHERIGQETTA